MNKQKTLLKRLNSYDAGRIMMKLCGIDMFLPFHCPRRIRFICKRSYGITTQSLSPGRDYNIAVGFVGKTKAVAL